MTQRRHFLTTTSSLLGASLLAGLPGCASPPGAGWTTLIDGPNTTSLDGWAQLGAGNWRITDGAVHGQDGKLGYLVSKDSYTDFEIHAEFWADTPANSGIFLRCQDRNKVGADNAYEVNIFDKRPDPSYGTAAIVDVAKAPQPYPQAADRWNTFHITAKSDRLVVVFNGQQTVDVRDARWRSGPIALQSAGGTIRFRKLQIRSL